MAGHLPTEAEMAAQAPRFRGWRMGQTSRTRLAALDWSVDPAPVRDRLAIFGPAGRDIIE